MRKEPKSARRHGRYDDVSLEEGGIIDTLEPDWDVSYTSPTSIERDRSTFESPWDNNSIAASQQDAPGTQTTRRMRPLTHLEVLCASHDCAIKQEPESLYYQTIAIDRPRTRPDPSNHGRQSKRKAKRAPYKTTSSRLEQTTRDTNHVRRAMKQNLAHSATEPKQRQQKELKRNVSNQGGIPVSNISFKREGEKRASAGCVGVPSLHKRVETKVKPRDYTTKATSTKQSKRTKDTALDEINTDFPTVPVPVISFRREEDEQHQRPTLGCTAVPSSIGTYFASKQVASVVKATQEQQQNDDQSSPTPVNDVLEELLELQGQLDSLRLTRPNLTTRDVLLDAARRADTSSELLDLNSSVDREEEELMGGVSFQAFESKRDAPDEAKATAFSKLVDVLAQHEPPALEEAVVDDGVRIRQFGMEGDGPGTPDSSFSIVVDEEEEDEEDDSSPTLLKPLLPKGSRRKSRVKKSKSDPTAEMSTLQKETLRSPKLSSTRDSKMDKFSPLMSSPREGPETPPPPLMALESDSWSPTPPYPKSRRESQSSPATIQVPASPRKPFSIRGALDSIRKPRTPNSSTPVLPPPGTRSVRFSKNLVTSVQYRPKTLPEEMGILYFSKEELDELEQDRDERIYEEQFEVVTGRDPKDVAVTYPVRRLERPPPSPRVQEQPTISPPVSPPGLLDISGSWSSTSSDIMGQANGFEI